MAFCAKCGNQLGDEVQFCPVCGQKVGEPVQTEAPKENAFAKAMDTEDWTAEFDPADIRKNKAMAILAYISALILIPVYFARDSKFARYHVGQSLNLVTAEVLLALTVKILGWIPIFGLIVRILCGLAGVGLTVLMVFGIINAARGKAKALPLCGTIKNMMTEQ